MMIVTARDFRGEQGRILARAARGEDIVITSRDHGSFKLVPITEDDTLISKEAFFKMLDVAEQEIKDGMFQRFETAEDAIRYLDSL